LFSVFVVNISDQLMIDTHAHLDFKDFDKDREEVIARFFSRGGKAIINIGVDLESSRQSIEIAKKNKNIFASVGLHPDFFSKAEKDLRFTIYDLRKLAKQKKVVAVGETGLDYFSHTDILITNKQKEDQKNGFLAQIEIAQELNLPIIVHCRDAWNDVFDIINLKSKIINQKFVLHCYSGGKKDTKKFLKLPNVYFSFSGNITYPKPKERHEKLAEAVRMISLDKIMLDSDAPFLAPQEMRGKRNEPSFIRYIAEKIAEIKKISVDKIEKATDETAESFFSI